MKQIQVRVLRRIKKKKQIHSQELMHEIEIEIDKEKEREMDEEKLVKVDSSTDTEQHQQFAKITAHERDIDDAGTHSDIDNSLNSLSENSLSDLSANEEDEGVDIIVLSDDINKEDEKK
eukprot:160228_1